MKNQLGSSFKTVNDGVYVMPDSIHRDRKKANRAAEEKTKNVLDSTDKPEDES